MLFIVYVQANVKFAKYFSCNLVILLHLPYYLIWLYVFLFNFLSTFSRPISRQTRGINGLYQQRCRLRLSIRPSGGCSFSFDEKSPAHPSSLSMSYLYIYTQYTHKLGLFGTLKLVLALQFIAMNTYFKVVLI